MSDLQKKIIAGLLPSKLPKPNQSSKVLGPKDYSPAHWSKYFQTKELFEISENNKFCVYKQSNVTDPKVPVVIFLHGGGYSGLTWARTVESLLTHVECTAFAVDLRGHGETITSTEDNLSTEVLVEDLIELVKSMQIVEVPIVVVGHSMGGALAIHFASEAHSKGQLNVVGLVVLDVVEGSALEALSGMSTVLRNRPTKFEDIPKAIEWCVRSGQTRDLESAKISMPGQLKHCETNKPATLDVVAGQCEEANSTSDKDDSHTAKIPVLRNDVILEDEEEENCEISSAKFVTPLHSTDGYTWRIDLSKTQPHWTGWFQGISSKFLQVPCPKLLLLAGIDRLDKDLTVGQMQGKFQMQVLPNVGHAVHEDSPSEVANSLASFFVRHKIFVGNDSVGPTYPGC